AERPPESTGGRGDFGGAADGSGWGPACGELLDERGVLGGRQPAGERGQDGGEVPADERGGVEPQPGEDLTLEQPVGRVGGRWRELPGPEDEPVDLAVVDPPHEVL